MKQINNVFADVIDSYDWNDIILKINSTTAEDVARVLAKARKNAKQLDVNDFMVLISDAASPFIEQMALLSRHFTQERFGKTISMYIPMYVSNACSNKCVYCGFNHDNKFQRTTLSFDQIRQECEAIKKLAPFDNLLIVSGEYPSICGVDYFEKTIDICSEYFNNISIEVQPMKTDYYARLAKSGLNGVVCFQETYHREAYKIYHPKGMKSDFEWRLNGFDRMGQAGIHKIGLGILIGLEDWRADVTMLAHHLRYLQRKYWRTKYSINFPRMRPSESGFQPNVVMTDRQLAQLTFAFRIFDHDVDISFSTRELQSFRDNMLSLGVTSMSAGSRTEPGGYAVKNDALEQFEISDDRHPLQVADAISKAGYDVVWKDWDAVLN